MTIKKLFKLFPFVSLISAVLYIVGIISQFLSNYDKWKAAGNTIGSKIAPEFPSANFFTCVKAVFDFPYGLYAMLAAICIILILIIFVFNLGHGYKNTIDRDRNMEYSHKGTYGTSGFMTDKERGKVLLATASAANIYGNILGIMDGKIISLPKNTRMNKNIAVYGASGSMKSRAFARNMVFQCVKRGESLIITDPKNELYESMSQYLRDNGYEVKMFNLVNPENSDSWHCLGETGGDELMTNIFCDVIIKNTNGDKSDRFWDNSELSLFKALALYVSHGEGNQFDSIGDLYEMITLLNLQKLKEMFEPLPDTNPAKAPFNIFEQSSDTVKSGIITGLATRLQVFQNEQIRQITGHREIDLTMPGKKKCAIFCITSDQDSTFDFLSSLFLTFSFIKLVRFADRYGENGALPVPVHILADELANIGVIHDLKKKISTIRSRNISISVIFQSLAQMQNRYPDNQWQEIIGNCDTQLFLGCTDEVTAKYISDRTGEITVGVSSSSKQLNTWRVSDYTPEYRQTSSTGKRKLLTPDEILRMPLDEALIILRGQKVLRVNKYDFEQHPEAKNLVYCKARDYVPLWRMNLISQQKQPPHSAYEKTDGGGFYIDNENVGGVCEDSLDCTDKDSHSLQSEDEKLVIVSKDSLF